MFGEWVLSHNRSNVTSYRNLKLFIGILGMALPVILVVGGLFYPGHTVQHSVSHYYHTDLRDALVGTLASASILFMTTPGMGSSTTYSRGRSEWRALASSSSRALHFLRYPRPLSAFT